MKNNSFYLRTTLFRKDILYRLGISLYESLPFPVYAILTFSYMFVIPLLLRIAFGEEVAGGSAFEKARNIVTAMDPGFFPIFGVMPIIGSLIGYRFFDGIFKTIDHMCNGKIISEKTREEVIHSIDNYCNSFWVVVLSIVLVISAFVQTLMSTPRITTPYFIDAIYLSIVSVVWWYFVGKGGIVCLITTVMLKRLIDGLKVNILHEDGFFGLRPVGQFSWNFLCLYCGLFGTYLTISFLLASGKIPEFWLTFLFLYLVVPILWFTNILWKSHLLMKEEKIEQAQIVEEAIRQIPKPMQRKVKGGDQQPINEWFELQELKKKIESLPSWPLPQPKILTLFTIYFITPISSLQKVVGSLKDLSSYITSSINHFIS